ncbi:MAG TPA: NAD(+) diphosphatase [Jatrophihabitantaceae bacterium]|jgi:NAD+ diphosphatase
MPDELDHPPRLARAEYDRAALHRTDAAWLAEAWAKARVLVISPDVTTPVERGDGAVRLALRDPSTVDGSLARRFLGVVDGVPYFTVTVPVSSSDSSGSSGSSEDATGWANLREVGAAADDLPAALLTSAVALEQWHARHQRCPRCGAVTEEAQAGWTRVCTNDGSEHFPRTDPAVIMLVHDGADLCLLGRGPQWGEKRFSTLAGFVEPGESLEAAVAREVFEEVGVAVTDVRYIGSQPWPFPSSLMVGFVARLSGDPSLHLDPKEMAEAHWFTRDEVQQAADGADNGTPADPDARIHFVSPRLSISRYLIDGWLARRW